MINKVIKKIWLWDYKELLSTILGCILFSLAINIFIVPNHLYNGGILGISQLLNSILQNLLDINLKINISGIINLVLNIPLFLMAYKMISKTFFRRTLLCIIIETILLTIIPSPVKPLIEDTLTNVIIGGMLAGYGLGILLTNGTCGGGTDIIGMELSMNHQDISVGKINRMINVIIYIISGILYGLPTMIYSIIYTTISSLTTDHNHKQNIISYVLIFTKNDPHNIIKYIKEELNRDATYWEGYGGYDKTKSFIIYSALSKYEMQTLEKYLNKNNKDAFIIKSDGINIRGNFKKNLTN